MNGCTRAPVVAESHTGSKALFFSARPLTLKRPRRASSDSHTALSALLAPVEIWCFWSVGQSSSMTSCSIGSERLCSRVFAAAVDIGPPPPLPLSCVSPSIKGTTTVWVSRAARQSLSVSRPSWSLSTNNWNSAQTHHMK